jgi:hypothetical protein
MLFALAADLGVLRPSRALAREEREVAFLAWFGVNLRVSSLFSAIGLLLIDPPDENSSGT